jgi:hypothetical protein
MFRLNVDKNKGSHYEEKNPQHRGKARLYERGSEEKNEDKEERGFAFLRVSVSLC